MFHDRLVANHQHIRFCSIEFDKVHGHPYLNFRELDAGLHKITYQFVLLGSGFISLAVKADDKFRIFLPSENPSLRKKDDIFLGFFAHVRVEAHGRGK